MNRISFMPHTPLIFLLVCLTVCSSAEVACDSTKAECRSPEDVVSFVQLGKAQPDIRKLTQDDHKAESNEMHEEVPAAKSEEAGTADDVLDEHPKQVYNWGVDWDDWYDDLMHLFPRSKGDKYELLNYGLADETDVLHSCAAKVKTGTPGRTLPFNYSSAANLYEELASKSPVSLKGAKVLDISSGRGGGTAFMSDCFCPQEIVGLDFSQKHAEHAKKNYERKDGRCPVKFVQGDAMKLPFDDGSFDVVVNVQASFEYPSYRTFAMEAQRVLRPGGAFLTADFRFVKDAETDAKVLEDVFAQPVSLMDITDKVVRSFAQNNLSRPFQDECSNMYRKAHGLSLTQFDEQNAGKPEWMDSLAKQAKLHWSTGNRKAWMNELHWDSRWKKSLKKKGKKAYGALASAETLKDKWDYKKNGMKSESFFGCSLMAGDNLADALIKGAMKYRMYVLQKKA